MFKNEEIPAPAGPENIGQKIKRISELKTEGKKNWEDKIKYLPEPVKEKLKIDFDRLKGYGELSEENLAKEMEARINEAYCGLVDSRFDKPPISNGTFLRIKLLQHLEKFFDNEPPEEDDLKKTARLFFDLDGLKAVNDLNSSHEQGNVYLKRVVNVLVDKKLANEFKQMGLDISVYADAGDEFSVILKGDFDLAAPMDQTGESAIAYVNKRIKEQVASIKADDLIDFTNPDIRKKFEDLGAVVPRDYKFKASIAGGGATLFDGLSGFAYESGLTFEQTLKRIMGKTLDLSNVEMVQNKTNDKKQLEQSLDEKDRFHLLVLYRNEEDMRLRLELEKVKAELKSEREKNQRI